MGLHIEWVPYGRAAARTLRERVAAAKADDPLAPVTVVVPSNHVGVATRRLLASGDLGPMCSRGVGLAAVSFMTPYRMAELLGARHLAGAGRRPVSTPVIAAALRRALDAEPGVFAPVASHAATETALVSAYGELREVSVPGLDAIAETGPRASDVVRLHRAARASLEPDWYDEQDLMTAAAAAFRDHGGHGLGTVVVFLPQRISRHTALLLTAAADTTEVAVLVGSTGDAGADAEVVVGLARLGAAVPARPAIAVHAHVAADRTRIVLASDADDEVRVAVRTVIDAVRAGTPLDRIAVLYAGAEPYARLAHEHLAAAGVNVNGIAVTPLAGRIAGRVLLGLLELPDRDFRRQDVFAWLASAPVLVDGRWAPTVAWERLSRDAGIVAGAKEWDQRLATVAHDNDAQAEAIEADPDEAQWRAERLRKDAERARALRGFVLALIGDLTDAAARPRRWRARALWARKHLHTLLGGLGRRDAWPDTERRAADRVDAALDRLAALDDVEDAVDLDVFARTLALELESDLGRVGRFGDGVLVGPITMGIGLDLDLVVVLGLAEGSFPAPVRDDSLLPDHEREAAGDDLPLRRGRVEREHRQLLATLAAATNHILGVPRGDLRRSSERILSRWVLDIASSLAGTPQWAEDLMRADDTWVRHTASFEAGVRTLAFPATEQEHHLRALMHAAPRGIKELARATNDAVLVAGATTITARRSADFTRFDGNLAGLAVPSPVASAMSATRMQRWAGCPYAYFLQDLLRVEGVENPEERLQINALDKGSLIHAALEQFIVEVLDRPEKHRPGPDEQWSAADRARIAEIGDDVCADYESRGLTGRPIFWRRDRKHILADLQRFLDEDDRVRRNARTRPLAAELAFGFGATLDAVPLALPDGRQLRFRGSADRVDIDEDGGLHIVDYKTGGYTDYTDLSEDEPDQRGRKLQLAVYGAAARQHQQAPDASVRAEYWFVSTKGKFRRIGYPITAKVMDRVGATLGTIVSGIEAGVFASHPTEVSSSPWPECEACDPDALGVVELRGAWERKRHDARLAPYAQLAEPLDDADAEVEEPEPEPADE